VTHPRRLVREQTKAALEGLARGDDVLSVYTNRVKDLEPENLPIAVILTNEETSERASKRSPIDRTIQLTISMVIDAEKSSTLDDDLDDWAELIEARLAQSPPASAQRCTLVATTLEIPDPEQGSAWCGFLFLEYEALVLGEES
jgi:hypothetical protein